MDSCITKAVDKPREILTYGSFIGSTAPADGSLKDLFEKAETSAKYHVIQYDTIERYKELGVFSKGRYQAFTRADDYRGVDLIDLFEQARTDRDNPLRGYNIPLGRKINDLRFTFNVDEIRNIFSFETGYTDFKITPREIKVYKREDLFIKEDLFEKGQIATIIYIFYNANPRTEITVNGEKINNSSNTVIILYPDSVYEVKKIYGSYITLIFKVFNSESKDEELKRRVKVGDAILLDQGEDFFQTDHPYTPKGLDAMLINSLNNIGYTCHFHPVIVEVIFNANNYTEQKDTLVITLGESTKFPDDPLKILVYNLNDKLLNYFGNLKPLSEHRVLYLNPGCKVGEKRNFPPSYIYYNLLLIINAGLHSETQYLHETI